MRQFDAAWHYDGSVLTDVTNVAGDGGMALVVQGGHKIYFGHEDWLSGFLYMVSSGASDLVYVLERWNGEAWEKLPQQESHEQLQTGFTVQSQAANFEGNGVADFGRAARGKWALKIPSATWPETAAPPDTDSRFWIRVRFTAGGPATLDRLLPLLYNTYATYSDLASYMGLPEFDEHNPPTSDEVRRIIRRHEDWLDNWTRRSWRPRYVVHETHDFNPYGVGLKRRPVLFLTSVGLWQGTKFESMTVGRGEDTFVDPATGMLYPNTPSFRLRYYSFLLSRYIRSPKSFRISYVYGADIDIDEDGGSAVDAVLARAAADLTVTGDWSSYLTSGLDTLPKPGKVQEWREKAQEIADSLRWPAVA